jgi:hypothetical protein
MTMESKLDGPSVLADAPFAEAVRCAREANADRFVVEDDSGAQFVVGESALMHWAALRHPGNARRQIDDLRSLCHSLEPVLEALKRIGFPLQPVEDAEPVGEGLGLGFHTPHA